MEPDDPGLPSIPSRLPPARPDGSRLVTLDLSTAHVLLLTNACKMPKFPLERLGDETAEFIGI